MWISNGGEVAKEKSLAIRNSSRTLMRFWMPNCYWQLGLGPLRSRNQEELYHGIRHFECIEAIFQICAFLDLRFSAFCLFRLSAFSGSLSFQTLCLFRLSAFSSSLLFQALCFFKLSAFSDSPPFQTLRLFRLSAFSGSPPFQALRFFRLSAFSSFPPFQALRLFMLSAFSGSLPFQALCLFRLSAFSGSPPFQTRCLSRFFAFSNSPPLQVFVFHVSLLSSPPLFRVWTTVSIMHFYKAFKYYCCPRICDDQCFALVSARGLEGR